MKRRFRIIPLAIVVFWLAMMGWFLWRETALIGSDVRQPLRLGPSDAWMTIYLPDRQPAGNIRIQETPERRDDVAGMRTSIRVKSNLVLLGRSTPIFATGYAWRSLNGKHSVFDFRLRSGDHDFRLEGTLEGGHVSGKVHTAGEAIPISFPVGDDFSLIPSIAVPEIEVGETLSIQSFDPLTLSSSATEVTCIREEPIRIMGEEVMAKVVMLKSSTMESKAWIGPNQEILRAETPYGFTIERSTAEEAMARKDAAPTSDLLAISAIQPTGKTPLRGARRMTVRIGGIREESRPPSDDTQQEVDTREYTIVTPDAIPAGEEESAEGLEEYLGSSPFVQSRHPKIRELAESIVSDAEDRPEKVRRLYHWVYTNINKVATFSVPSALDVLETREGDCNENTVLYAALARAVGIPCRIAVGVVWSHEFDGFYYHAWPEVYSGGRWTWVDPTLGQPIADATHIKLLSGEIQRWTELIPYMSRLKIEVLDVS